MTKEQATLYLKSVDKVENQSPVKICILFLSSTNRLKTYPLITISPLNAREVTCGLPAFLDVF
jgi:hypothetical protein